MKMKHTNSNSLMIIGLTLLLGSSCGETSSDSSDGSSSSSSSSNNPDSLALTSIVDSYPDGLAVSALSVDTSEEASTTGALAIESTSLRLSSDTQFKLAADIPACSNTPTNSIEDGIRPDISPKDEKHPTTKMTEERQRIASKDINSCFTVETVEAVRDALRISASDNADGTGCYRPDWGIIGKSQAGETEPCMVSHARNEFFEGSAYIDVARSIASSMVCSANAEAGEDGVSLDEDSSIDLTAYLVKATEKFPKVSVTKAKITVLPDDGDYAVYRSDIQIAITIPKKDQTEFEVGMGIHIVHSPRNDDNSEYQGTIWLDHPLMGPRASEKYRALSVNYLKSSDSDTGLEKLNFEMRMAKVKLGVNPFDSVGSLDFNAEAKSDGSYPTTNANDHMDTIKHITYEGYPTEHVQNLSYWVNFGGRYEESARGYTFNMSRNSGGEIIGCALAGATPFGLSIRKALKTDATIMAEGYWRPFCQNAPQTGNAAWKQCFKRSSDGSYVLDNVQNTTRGYDFVTASESGIRPPKRDGFKPPPPGDAPEI